MDPRDRARALLADDRAAEAVQLLSDHLATNPDDAAGWDDAAEALLRLGQAEGAIPAAHRGWTLAPTAESACLLAVALAGGGRAPLALQLLEAALADPPPTARAWERMARAYEALGAAEAGVVARQQALERAPTDAGVALRLAERLERADRREEARTLANRVLAAAPGHTGADRLLVRIDHHDGRLADAAARARRLLARGSLSGPTEQGLWMELARVEARQDQPGAAFAAAAKGNALALDAWVGQGGDLDAVPRLVSGLMAAQLDPPPPPEATPGQAFVVGFPRSGTTLVQQILAAHPGVVTLDELPLLEGALGEVAPGAELPDVIARMGDLGPGLRDAWWRRARAAAPPDRRLVVDKQPLNLLRVDLLSRLFPGAPIVVVVRDPRDAVLSAFLQDFELNWAMAQCADLVRCAELFAGAFDLWLRARDQLPRAIELRYEDLVARPEATLRPVLALLGLPWNDAVLDHAAAASRSTIGTPSYRDVRQPLFDRSVGRWRRFAGALAPVLPRLAPYAEALGYR